MIFGQGWSIMTDDWGSGNSVLRHTENRDWLNKPSIPIIPQLHMGYPQFYMGYPQFFFGLWLIKHWSDAWGPSNQLPSPPHRWWRSSQTEWPRSIVLYCFKLVPNRFPQNLLHHETPFYDFFEIVHLSSSMAILGYSWYLRGTWKWFFCPSLSFP